MSARWLGLALLGALLGACQGEPDLLCDRVRVLWPYFELDPSSDVSEDPGLQIDLVLRTGFLPGTIVSLDVENEDMARVFEAEVEVDDEGVLRYLAVELPEGPVSFILEAANECGDYRTAASAFVWDGRGFPACEMNLADAEPVMRPAFADPVLGASSDADLGAPGFQGSVVVDAGRPDMEVTLFVLDLVTGSETAQVAMTGDDDRARFDVELDDGQAAMRAVCLWPPRQRRISSTTRRFAIDTEVPSCALAEPTAAVTAADDLDGDADNGIQFSLRGTATGDDLVPSSARFTVEGADVFGTELVAGESRAESSFPGPETPAVQELGFAVEDLAGNECSDQVSFER